MEETVLDRHVFVFNPTDNGGESLCLVTNFIMNKSGEIFTTQELTLQSYCNSASFALHGAQITSDKLRELANQLDAKHALVKAKAKAA